MFLPVIVGSHSLLHSANQDSYFFFQCKSVGRPKHIRVMAGALEGDVFIGRKAQEFRGLLKIKYPMEHGIVTDWDDMERIWSWVYAEELGTLSEEVCDSFPYGQGLIVVR
jgi:centractin